MLERALATGVRFGWVTGDTVYGGDRRLRVWLEEHAIRHVMAVKCTEPVWALTEHGPGQVAAQDLIAQVPAAQWLRSNAGDGSKGRRFYDWTRVPLWRWGWPANVGFWLLARRSLSDPGELAYYSCFGPADTPLVRLVQVAGSRWRVELAFEQAKGEVGLDHDQVRQYRAWYRHVTLAMTALACLAVTRAQVTDPTTGVGGCRGDRLGVLVALTVAELRRLLVRLVWRPQVDSAFTLAWSVWRRRHQATARRAHYQQQRRKPRL